MLQRIKENKSIQYALFGIVLYLNLLALCHVDKAKGLGDNAGETIAPLFYAIGTGILLVRYLKVQDFRRKVFATIGGVLLAFSHVYGVYLHYVNNLFVDAGQVIFLLLVVTGVSITTVPLFSLLFEGIEKAREWYSIRVVVPSDSTMSKGVFLKYWVGIFVCYIPVFLAYWPVNFIYDAKYQMREVINNAYRIHHPLLHTWFMGVTYNLGGELFDSVSIGISFYTIIQMLVCSLAFAYVLFFLYKQGVPKVFRVISFLFFALFPLNSIFVITATKDVLFAAFYLIFFVTFVRIYEGQEQIKTLSMALIIVSGVLMLLFRRNALYALVAASPFLVWGTAQRKKKVIVLIALISTIVLSNLANNGLITVLNATSDDSVQESSSVFVQTMARVADYRGEELTPELYEEMLLYWEEGFEEEYNPYLSDPIKNTIDRNLLEENFVNFLKLWGKVGMQFPGEYLESILTNTMGYWYMGDVAHYMAVGDGIAVYHTLIETGEEIVKNGLCPLVEDLFAPLFLYGEYREIPVLAFLFRSSAYTWLLFVFSLYMMYKKEYKKIMVPSLSIMYIGTCLLGPWVALRYIYAIVVTTPLMIYLLLEKKE